MTTVDINKVILPNSAEFRLFPDLNKNSYYEPIRYDRTAANIPKKAPYQEFEKTLFSSSVIQHSGDIILDNSPYDKNRSRPLFDYYNGRNLGMLKTLEANSKPNYPDFSTPKVKVIGKLL